MERDSDFYRMKQICDNRRAQNKLRVQEGSKRRLMNIIKKNFTTVMIGSLAEFEKTFGHLWGHGLNEDEITNEQLQFRELWEETRSKILDLGHGKINGSMDEISRHTINWDRYQSTILFDK